MSSYTGPGMTVTFKQNNTPSASAPSALEVVLVGRAVQVEKDLYLGAYSYASGLSSATIPDIRTGATLISDDEITVNIQLDANSELVEVPSASWSRSGTAITIVANLVDTLIEKTAAADQDATLVIATRLLSSVAVDFDEIGVVQGYSLVTLIDEDDLSYDAYDCMLASGTDAGKLYLTGSAPLPALKLTVDSIANFAVGDDVTQAVSGATGTIVALDTLTMVLGDVVGTFTTASTNAITNSGTGSCTASAGKDLTATLFGFTVTLKMDGAARVDYKAMRTDLCGVKTKVTTSTLLTIFDNEHSLTPENELGWAAKIATDVADYCYIVGVDDLNGYIHDYNSTASNWNTQFAFLKLQLQTQAAYQYVVLSENSEVHAYMDLFISWMRTPSRSKLSIGWSSFASETMDYVIRATALPSSHGTTTAFSVSGETFLTKGCLDGGYVIFRNPADSSDDATIRAVTVDSESAITLATAMPTMDDTWTYEFVNAIYTLDEIANAAKVYAEGYSSRAIRFCWNKQLDMTYNGTTYYDIPRYYWFVYRAAVLSGTSDLSQTFTRTPVSYLFETSEIPFELGDTDRIDTVASGGVDIIMQDTDGAPLYSYDALTTDMTDNVSKYQSVTHQFDYAALVCFESYRPYIGRYKIDNKVKAMLLNLFGSIQRKLASKQCLEYLKLIQLAVDPDDDTRMILETDGSAIKPFRGLDIRMWMN